MNGHKESQTSLTIEAFPGAYEVEYVAVDHELNTATCSYTVNVVTSDQTAPYAVYCPKSQTVESTVPLIVGWDEPIFEDNSGFIKMIESNYKPTDVFAWGPHDVVYTAYDNSSNSAQCAFSVTVRGAPCSRLDLPAFGSLVCHDSYSGSFCVPMCGEDGDFQVPTPELTVPRDYLCSSSGNWYPYEYTYSCLEPYGDAPLMGPDYYFSGLCNETVAQTAMKQQALNVFNVAQPDITLGTDLSAGDFYVMCGPR